MTATAAPGSPDQFLPRPGSGQFFNAWIHAALQRVVSLNRAANSLVMAGDSMQGAATI
jgi:hypothetical protein